LKSQSRMQVETDMFCSRPNLSVNLKKFATPHIIEIACRWCFRITLWISPSPVCSF